MLERKKITSLIRKNSKWLIWLLLLICIYFANRELQSYWGQQTLNQTGLAVLSLPEALKKAQIEDKKVLADMSAIWCSTCRKLDKLVFSDQRVKRVINQHYVFARIEYDSSEGQDFMQKYGVYGFPTVLVLNAQGEKLQLLPLIFEPQSYVNLLNKALKQ